MYVFAKVTAAVNHGGITFRLVRGDVWYAADPIVTARPDLFSEVAPVVNGRGPVADQQPEIETADARPGQKRSTRAKRKS